MILARPKNHCTNRYRQLVSGIVCALIFCSLAFSSTEPFITLHCVDQPLKSVLSHISQQSKVNFVFRDQLIEDKTVTCHFINKPVEDVLETLFHPIHIARVWTSGNTLVFFEEREGSATVEGFVSDAETQTPLPWANITVSGTTRGSTTNEKGYFQLNGIDAAPCSLNVSYIGYHTEKQEILASDSLEPLKIVMKQNPIQTENIQITRYRDRSFTLSKGHAGSLQYSPSVTQSLPTISSSDIGRTLQFMPGISARPEKSSELCIWGGERNHNLITLDGIPVCYRSEVYFGMLSPFHPRAIETVNVHKGAYSAQYGDCIGGIVELTGNSMAENQSKMGAGVDLFQMNGFIQIPISKKLKLFWSLNRSFDRIDKGPVYQDVYTVAKGSYIALDPAGDKISDYSSQNDRYAFFRTLGKLTFDASPKDQFNVTFYSGREKELFNAINNSDNNKYQFESVWKWRNVGLASKWSHHWNLYNSSTLHFVFTNDLRPFDYFTNKNRLFETQNTQFDTTHIEFTMDTYTLMFKNTLKWRPVVLNFGAEVLRRLPNFQEASAFYIPYSSSLSNHKYYHFSNRQDEIRKNAVYVQSDWGQIKNTTFGFGVRVVAYQSDIMELVEGVPTHRKIQYDPHVMPRISVDYDLSKNITLKSTWGRYYQYFATQNDLANNKETFHDLWWHADDKTPPNLAEHGVVELLYQTSDYVLAIEAYHKKIRQITMHRNDAPFYFTFPSEEQYWKQDFLNGSGTMSGFDITLQKRRGRLITWLCYDYGDVIYQFQQINNGSPFSPKNHRKHELKAVASYSLGVWDFTMTAVYGSPVQSFNDAIVCTEESSMPVNLNLPYYQQVGLNIQRKFKLSQNIYCDLGMSFLNVFNYKKIVDREILTNMENGYYEIQERRMLPFTPLVFLNILYD